MRQTQEIRDKVVLVGLNSPVLKKEENASEDTMEELSALVETAGGETVGIVLQNRRQMTIVCRKIQPSFMLKLLIRQVGITQIMLIIKKKHYQNW